MEREIEYIQRAIKKGEYFKALRESKKLIKKEPDNIYVLNFIGLSLQGLNEIVESLKYFKKALLINDKYIPALNNLAISHKSLGDIDLARKAYEKIILLNDKHLPALNNLAFMEQEYNNHNRAFKLFNKILDLDDKDQKTLYHLALIKSQQGNLEEAHNYIKKILNINPKNISAHSALAEITTYDEKNEDSIKHLGEMKELIKDKTLELRKKIKLSSSLGKAFEDIKNIEKAFFYYNEANFLKTPTVANYNFKQDKDLFKSLELFFLEYDFKNGSVSNTEKEIIFICGLPRSGTTLIEQILSSHDNVMATGELNYLSEALYKYIIKEPYNFNKKLIDKLILSGDVQNYYNKRLNNYKVESSHIIDKAPMNFRWAGFIKLFFPNAKIIHVSRNAEDNCLSLYKSFFDSNNINWIYSQKNIANYYNIYVDLMKFWEKKLPNFIYNLKYENLINNKENEIQKLLKFCNLEWDNKCLNHSKSKLPIKTASIAQARKPLYSSSINLSKRYTKHLKEMFGLIKKNNIH